MRHIIINVKYCLMFTRAHHIKFSLYFRLNYVVILYRHRCRPPLPPLSPSKLMKTTHTHRQKWLWNVNDDNDDDDDDTNNIALDSIHLIFAAFTIIINNIIIFVSCSQKCGSLNADTGSFRQSSNNTHAPLLSSDFWNCDFTLHCFR